MDIKTNAEEVEKVVYTFLEASDLINNQLAAAIQKDAFDEEAEELRTAFKEQDLVDILDAIGDCGFVACSLKYLDEELSKECFATMWEILQVETASLDIDKARSFIYSIIDEVALSNLSKFDASLEDAEATKKAYEEIGVLVEIEQEENTGNGLWYTYAVNDCTDINGKEYFKGKILKSVNNFRMPNFIEYISRAEEIFTF